MDIKETALLGDAVGRHWYYVSKARALRRAIGPHAPYALLDVGAGSGYFSRDLLSRTTAARSTCVDINYERDERTEVAGKPLEFVRHVDRSDADLVLMIDVLEHVDDDVGLLREYVEKVAPGTTFVLSVPAFQWLWSPHDEFLEHKRRYTLRQIEQCARDAGLVVERGMYFFAFVFPLAVIARLFARLRPRASAHSQLRRHSAFVNGALAFACRCEYALVRANRWFGLTAFCRARKA